MFLCRIITKCLSKSKNKFKTSNCFTTTNLHNTQHIHIYTIIEWKIIQQTIGIWEITIGHR